MIINTYINILNFYNIIITNLSDLRNDKKEINKDYLLLYLTFNLIIKK